MPSKLLTKAEAAKRAGISVRSLERYTSQGKIAVGYRNIAKGKEAVYEVAEVNRLRDELKADRGAVVLPPERQEVVRQESAAPEVEQQVLSILAPILERLADAISSIKALPPAPASPTALLAETVGPQAPPTPARAEKLTLTIPEAAELVGSSAHSIRAAIHAGELHAIKGGLGRGWRIRRSDLEEWLANL